MTIHSKLSKVVSYIHGKKSWEMCYVILRIFSLVLGFFAWKKVNKQELRRYNTITERQIVSYTIIALILKRNKSYQYLPHIQICVIYKTLMITRKSHWIRMILVQEIVIFRNTEFFNIQLLGRKGDKNQHWLWCSGMDMMCYYIYL